MHCSVSVARAAFGLVVTAILLSVCAQSATQSVAARGESQGAHLQAIIASSDLALGRNRFTFGLVDNNRPLSTGRPKLTFYFLRGNAATRTMSTVARFNNFARGLKDTDENSAAIEIGGVYVSYPTFRKAGNWGVEIRLRYKGHNRVLRDGFVVRRHSRSPNVGSPAPRSHNPTTAQLPLSKLDSGKPATDMHKLSIAQAISQHKPLVVLFATAGFCTSRLCGPEIEVVQRLERQYRGRVNFVHIEIYKNARPPTPAPTFVQWGLETEPWVFVVNRRGIVSAKFEGPTPASEIAPAIKAVLR